jgi:uncharacterized protein YjiS (DUF1127 family)
MSNLSARQLAPPAAGFGSLTHQNSRGWFGRLLAPLAGIARAWLAYQRHQRAMAHVLELDDHLLKDIGMSRGQALLEATRPFELRAPDAEPGSYLGSRRETTAPRGLAGSARPN